MDSVRVPLYRRLIGQDYERMPSIVQRMHDVRNEIVARGMANLHRPKSNAANFLGTLMGMPPAGIDLPAYVTFTWDGKAEVLRRKYGTSVLETIQQEGTGRDTGHLLEKFGPVSLVIKLIGDENQLSFQIVRARLFGMLLPKFAWPTLDAREWEENGWYRFSVAIGLPILGQLIHYEGSLKIEAEVARGA